MSSDTIEIETPIADVAEVSDPDTSGADSISSDILNSVFSQSNLNMIFLFLAIYFIVVLFLAVFFRDTLTSLSLFTGQVVDVLVFGTIIYYALYKTTTVKDGDILTAFTEELKRQLNDFDTVIYLGVLLLGLQIFITVFSFLTMSSDMPISINLISAVSWIYLIVVLVIIILTRVFKIPITDKISSMFTIQPVDTTAGDEAPVDDETTAEDEVAPIIVKPDEVFNVSNNLYTYDDAQNVCSTFGARLASYDDIEDAYNKGGEWCNYGWSEGQMAYFPTQKDTWASLQKSAKTANSCGRPGVNGGYIVNPNVKFGVNCFGQKPDPRPSELLRMQQSTMVRPMEDNTELDAKLKYWRDNMDEMLTVNSYNKTKWSAY
jgi:hypothetical protein